MRSDIHRPSATEFDPDAYTYCGAFDSNPDEGCPGEIRKAVADLVAKGYRFGAGSSSKCGHCGAFIRYAALMVREDVKEFIFVGQTCLGNRFDGLSAAEFKRLRESARLSRERATKAERVAAVLAENPGLAEALNADHYIADDIRWRFEYSGQISEKQIELVFKVAAQAAERAIVVAEREAKRAELVASGVSVPTGRLVIEGKILSTKWVENDFGGSLKMLVESAEGWKVWGTVPSALSEFENGTMVRFTATVEPSKDDPVFGFFKRPTKAEVLVSV